MKAEIEYLIEELRKSKLLKEENKIAKIEIKKSNVYLKKQQECVELKEELRRLKGHRDDALSKCIALERIIKTNEIK